VLARLEEIDGVASCSTNASGTFILVSLRPGADPARVAERARNLVRILAHDRVGILMPKNSAASAYWGTTWRNSREVAEQATLMERQRAAARASVLPWIVVLLLAELALGYWIYWVLRQEACLAQAELGGTPPLPLPPKRAA
jgi:hypothetical protein